MKSMQEALSTKIAKTGSLAILLLITVFILSSCGGSDVGESNEGATQETVQLSGLVASGAPLQRTFVTFRDGEGNRYTDITDTNGKYTNVNLAAAGLTLPVLIRVQHPDAGILYSYASRTGTANVHPLTDPIIRAWYRTKYPDGDLDEDFFSDSATFSVPTAAEISFIKTIVMDVMKNLLTAMAQSSEGLKDADGESVEVEDFDPMETPIEADGTGFDRILDETEVGTSEESGNLNIVVEDGSTLETNLVTTGGSTTITIDTDNIDQTDTTPPEQPSAPVAAQISATQILITWSYSDATADADISYYKIYRDGTKIGTSTSTSFIDPGVTAGGTYSYTLEAYDGAGNASDESDPSNSVTIATITTTDTTNPTAGTVTATSLSFNEIKLTWRDFTDDVGILNYKVYRCQDDQGTNPTFLAKVQGTSFVHFNLTANTTYYYAIKAYDATGNASDASNLASATTGQAPITVDITPPAAPTNFDATADAYNQITLTWTAPTAADLAGYFIYRGASVIVMLASNVTSYTDTGLVGETPYSYWIKAFDRKGNLSEIAVDSATTPEAADTTAPSVPTGVRATVNSATQVTITWNASSDSDSGIAGYYIYRDGEQIDSSTTRSYADTGLTPETTYSYKISAYDNALNESAQSAAASATTPAGALPDVSTLITEAKTRLEAQNIPGAKVKFEAAYALNPTDKDACFGLAICEGIMLLEHPDVIDFFELYETYKPTIDNVLYGVLDDTYEVWGGSSPHCDDGAPDPNHYTKLSSASNPQFTFSGYSYYVIYTLPFSEVELSVSGNSIYVYCDNDADITSWSSPLRATIGGQNLFGASLTIHSINSQNIITLSAPNATQQRMLGRRARRIVPSAHADRDIPAALEKELTSLLKKFPKNKTSLRTKLRIAARSLADEPPTPGDVQTLINTSILPTIRGMIEKLRKVEGEGYTFTVTPAMTGGAETENIVLDDGEFYALEAMLSVARSVLNIMTAYNLDVDYDIMEYDPLSQINSSTFFTLKADGATKMATALSSLRNAVNKTELAYDFIFDEWGYAVEEYTDAYDETCDVLVPQNNVTDNGISLHSEYDATRTCEDCGPYDFLAEDDEDIRLVLNAAQMALAGEVTYTEEIADNIETTTITDGTDDIVLYTEDTDDPDEVFTIRADITKFFTDPFEKDDLPTIAYDLPINVARSQIEEEPVHVTADGVVVDCDIYMTSDLPNDPNYTLHGILPDGVPDFDGITYLDSNSAVVLDPNTWAGVNQSVATDGTSIYLYKHDYWGADSAKIWKIDPSSGDITATYPLTLTYQINSIRWINDMTWHNGALWATGGYVDASYNDKLGVFQINLGNSQSANQVPISSGIETYNGTGGLASDGENLYVGVRLITGDPDEGIAVVDPSSDTEIPSTLLSDFDDEMPWQMFYGGGYLWLEDAELKVDPATGEILKEYGTQGWINLYLNEKLYSVDSEDGKIHVFIEP
ncbi:MAG: fibronectin type III domain-containing protein [bacterium]